MRSGLPGVLSYATDLVRTSLLPTVRDMHVAIAGHAPFASVHLPAAGLVYDGVGLGLRVAGAGLSAADHSGERLEDGPRGRFTVAMINGLFGDQLAEEHPHLAITMAVRHDGHDVPLETGALAASHPAATGDLVVFLPGLVEDESAWWARVGEHGSYGDRLAADTGWTPVYLRQNSGLPIAENGVALASLMGRLVEAWPVDVRRIALVGHSLGGLVIRTACAVRTDDDRPWTDLVTNIVTLGTPHLGAPIAQALVLGADALGKVAEAAPIGRLLDRRSAGIVDLRRGLPRKVTALPHVRHHLVAGTLTRSPRHPVGAVAGDMLVRYPSAVGRDRRGRETLPGADVLHVPNADHFDLLNHDDVYAALREWLS
ncbi:MAG: alpha/beta hydrolase [Nocardioidaceae bacterium]|nr:alpha/beta hydrolase [Nocardioidaceae bacterium]